MIRQQPLTVEQRRESQRNYNLFNLINGLSYMCLGETVLILLAVRLGCPDYIVSALGAMLYFGYLLLPLGKIVTARTGAARSQSIFWVARNIAALLVACSALVCISGFRATAMGLLLTGAFFFYGFRAAGVVMSQPLIGNITTDADRGKVIGVSTGLFYVSCLVALVTISLLLKLSDSLGMLTGIIVVGALCGFTSSRFINRIDETEGIRNSARKPIAGEFRKVLRDRKLLRLLAAGFCVNLAVIMLIPISMLALKRGCGVSDTGALLFALGQFGASAAASFLSGKVANTIGPRKTMLYAYILMLGIGLLWLVAPANFSPVYMIMPFLLAGSMNLGTTNSVTHYFLQTVPEERRVASSMFIAVINGAGAGIAGMTVTGALLDLCAGFAPEGNPLYGYRIYFAVATVLLSVGIWVIARLRPLPLEKRKVKKSWDETI